MSSYDSLLRMPKAMFLCNGNNLGYFINVKVTPRAIVIFK